MSRLTIVREREQTQGEPEQAMPQVRRTLIANEGEYRQVQRKPNAHDFQNHSHGALTVQYPRPFRAGAHMQKLTRYARAMHKRVCLNHLLELLLLKSIRCRTKKLGE